MRMSQFLISIIFTTFVYANVAMAADATQPTNTNDTKLETISGTTTAEMVADDKCPMLKDSKDHKEHHGEPCPYHGKDHHKAHEKCDHEQRKE